MRADFTIPLREPGTGEPLELTPFVEDNGRVSEGVLKTAAGRWYPITGGVPCLLTGSLRPDFAAFAATYGLPAEDAAPGEQAAERQAEQARTNATFSDKWRRFKRYGLEPQHEDFLFEWYCKKLGLPHRDALAAFYASKSKILEIGPGSGFNARFMARHCPGVVVAADVSDAAHTTHENTRELGNALAVQADVMDLPFDDGTFDFAIADGVLHHTPDTHAAVRALWAKVAPGGRMFFYVYKQMGPARRFCDNHIREAFMPLEPEACYEACEGLTELGRALSRLNATVTLEKPVPVLGIPAGTHDVQRLLYYNFVKCFWNDAFDYETNNMVNFDWYHPHNAWQHTEDEVRGWLEALGAADIAFNDANPNGISTLATKPG